MGAAGFSAGLAKGSFSTVAGFSAGFAASGAVDGLFSGLAASGFGLGVPCARHYLIFFFIGLWLGAGLNLFRWQGLTFFVFFSS